MMSSLLKNIADDASRQAGAAKSEVPLPLKEEQQPRPPAASEVEFGPGPENRPAQVETGPAGAQDAGPGRLG